MGEDSRIRELRSNAMRTDNKYVKEQIVQPVTAIYDEEAKAMGLERRLGG